MVALPGQLFTNTPIPACIWFLTKSKKKRGEYRDRTGETLFIDARACGSNEDRTLRIFSEHDINKIASAFHTWTSGKNYADVVGFCKAVAVDDIARHSFALTPGRYVGVEQDDSESIAFEVTMRRLADELAEQRAKATELDDKISVSLERLGYPIG